MLEPIERISIVETHIQNIDKRLEKIEGNIENIAASVNKGKGIGMAFVTITGFVLTAVGYIIGKTN